MLEMGVLLSFITAMISTHLNYAINNSANGGKLIEDLVFKRYLKTYPVLEENVYIL